MPEIAGFGGAATHFAVPALVIDAIQKVSVLESGGAAERSRTGVGVMAGRLLDLAACLDWIHQERARPLVRDPARTFVAADFHSRENQFRLLGAMVSHSLACIRTLWDTIPPAMDRHLASKPKQIPDSFNDLAGKAAAKDQRLLGLLGPDVVSALSDALDSFRLGRKLRDGILHNGYQVFSQFSNDELPVPYVHFALGPFDMISNKHVENGMEWYVATDVIRELLVAWLTCWNRLRPALEARVDPTKVPGHGLDQVWGFHLPAMVRMAELLGNGSHALGWWFVWPCDRDCAGVVGGCKNPGGAPPSSVPTTPVT